MRKVRKIAFSLIMSIFLTHQIQADSEKLKEQREQEGTHPYFVSSLVVGAFSGSVILGTLYNLFQVALNFPACMLGHEDVALGSESTDTFDDEGNEDDPDDDSTDFFSPPDIDILSLTPPPLISSLGWGSGADLFFLPQENHRTFRDRERNRIRNHIRRQRKKVKIKRKGKREERQETKFEEKGEEEKKEKEVSCSLNIQSFKSYEEKRFSADIDDYDSLIDISFKISQGNPGALNVIAELLKTSEIVDPLTLPGLQLLHFNQFGIFGSKIWILYKKVCQGQIELVHVTLRALQLGIINPEKVYFAIENETSLEWENLIRMIKNQVDSFYI